VTFPWLTYRKIGTRSFASSRSISGFPNLRDPRYQSMLTSFAAIGTSLYRPSQIGALNTRSSNSRDPMCRDADNSRSRSLGTSLLARPSDSCLDSRCRDADIPRHLSHHLSVAHTVHVIIGMSLLAFSQLPWPSLPPLSRELPICRFTSRAILLVIPIDAPTLLSFELSPHLHDGFLEPLQDPMPRILANSPWRIPTVRSSYNLKQALIPRSLSNCTQVSNTCSNTSSTTSLCSP
jgi:hypothetical protein